MLKEILNAIFLRPGPQPDTRQTCEQPITIYRPTHFCVEEFIDQTTIEYLRGLKLDPWLVMDWRVLWTADAVWQYFNDGKWAMPGKKRKVHVNNWLWGGAFKYRGFRPPSCSEGASLSQHRFGRALDYDVEGVPAEMVRHEIMENQNENAFKYITCIEDGVTWNHNDCRASDRQKHGIVLIKA